MSHAEEAAPIRGRVLKHQNTITRLEVEYENLRENVWKLGYTDLVQQLKNHVAACACPACSELYEKVLVTMNDMDKAMFRLSINYAFGIFTRPVLDETFYQAHINHKDIKHFPQIAVCWDFDGMKRLNGLCGKEEVNRVVRFFLDTLRSYISNYLSLTLGIHESEVKITIYAFHSGDEQMAFIKVIPKLGIKGTLNLVRQVIAKFLKFLKSKENSFTLRLLRKKWRSKNYRVRGSEARKRTIKVKPKATFYVGVVNSAKEKNKLFRTAESSIEGDKKKVRDLARSKRRRNSRKKNGQPVHKTAGKVVEMKRSKVLRAA